MEFSTLLLWLVVNDTYYTRLKQESSDRKTLDSLIQALFPGIRYSPTEFNLLMDDYVIPVLKKIFPHLEKIRKESVKSNMTINIEPFFRSASYIWKNDVRWQASFLRKLKRKR